MIQIIKKKKKTATFNSHSHSNLKETNDYNSFFFLSFLLICVDLATVSSSGTTYNR